jgi:hypothetical protein
VFADGKVVGRILEPAGSRFDPPELRWGWSITSIWPVVGYYSSLFEVSLISSRRPPSVSRSSHLVGPKSCREDLSPMLKTQRDHTKWLLPFALIASGLQFTSPLKVERARISKSCSPRSWRQRLYLFVGMSPIAHHTP